MTFQMGEGASLADEGQMGRPQARACKVVKAPLVIRYCGFRQKLSWLTGDGISSIFKSKGEFFSFTAPREWAHISNRNHKKNG
jgi:hypothetical protein